MTKYDELAGRAVALAARLNKIEVQCRQKAAAVIRRFAEVLEAPEGRVSAVDLNDDLSFPPDVKHKTGWPEVVQGADGLWYFGIRVTYGDPQGHAWLFESIVLAIRADTDPVTSFGLQLADGSERKIESSDDLDEFLNDVIADTERRLVEALQGRRKSIGFTTSAN
ncbi:hypothetical protein [Burkholderia sp. BCC1970]|uniref:hypothetical protein n=1 Tax=Burkholderia sp. BCC1970 TaxID=2817437 RepID=UPI002ABD3C47|nr:hypothetical protein [Burkholderia sp. BCC1970]